MRYPSWTVRRGRLDDGFRKSSTHPTKLEAMRSMSKAVIAAGALVSALCTLAGAARAFDDAQYPDFNGRWVRPPSGVAGQIQPPFDPTKPSGLAQQAPFTPE